MACSLDKIKRKSKNKIRSVAKKSSTLVTFLSNGDISIPYKTSINGATTKANKIIDKVNTWSKETFNQGDKYDGQWLKLHTSPVDVRLEIMFPQTLEEDYKAQDDRENARAIQRLDAQRNSIAFDDYDDRYKFDFMLDTSDGYNYGLYLSVKEDMQRIVASKISTLKTQKQDEEVEKQLAQFKEFNKRLKIDIANLKSEPYVLQNYFNYFKNDLDTIEEILVNNPSMANLLSAKDFLQRMTFVYDTDYNTENEKRFIEEGSVNDIEDEATKKMFKDFIARRSNLIQDVRDTGGDVLLKDVDNTLNDKKTSSDPISEDVNVLTKLLRKAKNASSDISDFEKWLLPIDGAPNASPLQKFIRTVYDHAVGNEETFNLQQQIIQLQPKLEKRLRQLGHINRSGFINTLISDTSYDIFRRATKLGHRLIGKYSEAWDDVENNVYELFAKAQELEYKKNKDIEDWNKLKQANKSIFLELEKNNVRFIDVRKLPEIVNDARMQNNYGNSFIAEESEQYKKEVIQSLIGKSGNREIAEKIYNQIIKEQADKIREFESEMENYIIEKIKEGSVSHVSHLSDTAKSSINQKYYIESPFAFSEEYERNGNSNVRKPYYLDGKLVEGVDVSTMKYTTYIPSNLEHFDEKFAKDIETDEILYKAWDLFSQSSEYINKNKDYQKQYDSRELYDTLNSEIDFVYKYSHNIWKFLDFYSFGTLRRIGKLLATEKYIDKSDLKLQGKLISIDKAIENESIPMLSMFQAASYSPNSIVNSNKLPKKLYKLIKKEHGYVPDSFKVSELVYEINQKKIVDNQAMNLSDTLNTQIEIIQKFKAQKEVESKLLFVKNQLDQVKLSDDDTRKQNAKDAVKYFIDLHLYGVNNRANWQTLRQGESKLSKIYTFDERKSVNAINTSINFINKRLPHLDKKSKEEAEFNLAALQSFKDSKGKVITTGSIVELIAIKAPLVVGLGLNGVAQIANYFIGDVAGRQNDGLEWSDGNFHKAKSYLRTWKKLTSKENIKLTKAIVNGLNIFQNSANEIDRLASLKFRDKVAFSRDNLRRWKRKWGQYVTNPLHFVGEVEKLIQTPQILAMLGDVKITDTNGNTVYAFNTDNLNDPHPAFILDDGVLKLKPEFDTPDNRATWITRNSKDYVELFSESGKIPEVIAKINGDYRETSRMNVKQTTIGALSMMFFTWLPAYVMRRFGPEEGVISNLVKSDRGSNAALISAFTATAYIFIGATTFVSPVAMLAVGAGYIGVKKFRKSMNEDKKSVLASLGDIGKELMNLQYAFRYGGAIGAKVLQQTEYKVRGNSIIKNDAILNIAGIKQKEGETSADFKKSKQRLQFLLVEASTTVSLLMAKILVAMMLFPDDDEDEKYKDQKTFYDRMINHPDVTLYYALENLLSRMGGDINLILDPGQFATIALDGNANTFFQKSADLINASLAEEPIYQKGPNEGKSKFKVKATAMIVPKGIQDVMYGNLPSLGFTSLTNKDYKPNDLINRRFTSDFNTLNDRRLEMKRESKKEIVDEQMRLGFDEKTAKSISVKITNKTFPTIDKLFYEDGSLKPENRIHVMKYEE